MDWSNYLPNGEVQVSKNDTDACVSYATTHAIEAQIYQQTGIKLDLSERFLAKMSGTTPFGNYVAKVFETIMLYGMVTDNDWNEPVVFDWQEYYADIPPDIIAKGKDFLSMWDIQVRYNIPESEVEQALEVAPVISIITAANPIHAVMRFAKDKYFDSYQPYVKEITSVHSNYQIIITPKAKDMLTYQFDDNPTVYILTDDATLVGVVDPEALAKTLKGRPEKRVIIPASQRNQFTIADSAVNK